MAKRPRHPNKEIEAAVAYAETQGWSWIKVSGHAWGKASLRASATETDAPFFVWSTPRVPEHHARQIKRDIDRCPHREEGKNDENV